MHSSDHVVASSGWSRVETPTWLLVRRAIVVVEVRLVWVICEPCRDCCCKGESGNGLDLFGDAPETENGWG